MRILTIICGLGASIYLSGCAVTKAAIDTKSEITVQRSLEDVTAARAIRARMARASEHDLNDISVDVVSGTVVLAGATPNATAKKEAERIAWSAPSVKKVGNEIYVGRSSGLGEKTKDELISTAIRTKMATSNNVRNLNYTIETRDGVVYLMGVARSREELSEAARLASITKGVREVVSYASIKGDMPNAFGATQPSQAQSQETIARIPDTSYTAPYNPPSVTGGAPSGADYWGTPVNQAPPAAASLSDPMAYSPPAHMLAPALPQTILDPEAPLSYSPGITQLDSDALDSGEPILRDVLTGEIITLPPGVKPLPYIPDGPGSLGAGGAPLPPGAVATPFVSAPSAVQAPTSAPVTALPKGESVTLTEPYTIDPKNGARIPIKWDGKQWVGVIR